MHHEAIDPWLLPGAFYISPQARTEVESKPSPSLAEVRGIRDAPVTDQELNEAGVLIVGSFTGRPSAKLANVLAQVEFTITGWIILRTIRRHRKVAGRCRFAWLSSISILKRYALRSSSVSIAESQRSNSCLSA